MIIIRLLFLVLCVCLSSPIFSQEDELNPQVKKYVDSLNDKSWKSRSESAEMALRYGNQALEKGLEINYYEGIVKSHSYIGVAYRNQGNYDRSLHHFFEALKLCEAYEFSSDLAYSHINIANIYYLQLNFDNARKYLEYALRTAKKLKDDDIFAYIYINYARLFRKEKNYDKALEYIQKVLEVRKKQGNPQKIMAVYAEEGKISRDKGDYINAINQLNEALHIAHAEKYTLDMLSYYHHLARTYLYAKNYKQAKHYARMSLMLHPELTGVHLRQNNYDILYRIYKASDEHDKALRYHELWTISQDSIKASEYDKSLSEMRVRYDSDKQEKDNEVLRAQNEKQTFIVIFIALVSILLIFTIYKSRKANKKLAEQQEEILQSHHEVLQKNEEIKQQRDSLKDAHSQIHKQHFDIRSSINYAKRIQEAILPELDKIREYLPESFVFYKPRDIVSGDIYFFDANKDYIFISAIDCTGHGVPGAFMSLIANDLIWNILLTEKTPEPDKILNLLHENVKTTLRQDSNQGQDGMDMTICVIYPDKKLVEFAGAKNPLFYIQNNETELIKGDVMPIGGNKLISSDKYTQRTYTKHSISLDTTTTFYMYSDGFQDQFGGKKGKKFMSRKFRKLLHSIHELPLNEQATTLENTLSEWMENGTYSQVDDILVMGFRV